jgi:hypothetical protein
LTERLNTSKSPSLNVGIKANDFINTLHEIIKKVLGEISSQQITRFVYNIDERIKQAMNKELDPSKETNSKIRR